MIGTDILSHVTMEFNGVTAYLSVKSCSSVALRAAGFIPINQTAFPGQTRHCSTRGGRTFQFLFWFGEVHVPAQIYGLR